MLLGSQVKLTCSIALLNISLKDDADSIFLDQVTFVVAS
jgi:hypothetical protein